MTADLVLASASPRRRELLAQIGVRHRVQAADVDETLRSGEAAADYVLRLARAKAGALPAGGLPVLGADTSVVVDGRVLGKPVDDADARAMLRCLSGREHQVLSAVALCHGARIEARLSVTRVWFRTVSDALVDRYVASGEPRDKAGGYGIQGLGGALVTRIDGSYTGVVGLPLAETVDLLQAFNVPFWRDIRD
ncbi:MAG: Maf family protein [Gammaproteobacteria bacterium]